MDKPDKITRKSSKSSVSADWVWNAEACENIQNLMHTLSKPFMKDCMGGYMKRQQGLSNIAHTTSFPSLTGVSHRYHFGSTNFFLNHTYHIFLAINYLASFNWINKKNWLEWSNLDCWIGRAEKKLSMLTVAAMPDTAERVAKVQSVKTLRCGFHIAFIRAMGKVGKGFRFDQQAPLLSTLSIDRLVDVNAHPATRKICTDARDTLGVAKWLFLQYVRLADACCSKIDHVSFQ